MRNDQGKYEFFQCTTPEQTEAAMRVRHQVYCIEKGWIDPATCPGDIEQDELDAEAVHFLAQRDGEPVGTTRVLRGDVAQLPAFEFLPRHLFNAELNQIVEISRLAVIPHNRSQDAAVFVGLGLAMWEYGMERGIRVCMAVADVPFYRLLMRMRFPVIAKAKPVEYMGSLCVPLAFDVPKMVLALKRESAERVRVGG
jgi:N-acyl-L-homoserine lactone synthetase